MNERPLEEVKKDVLGAALTKRYAEGGESFLSRSEYEKVGKYSKHEIENLFSSGDDNKDGWNQLKKDLGLEIISSPHSVDEVDFKRDVLGAALTKKLYPGLDRWENENALSRKEYDKIGKYSGHTIADKFSSEEETNDGWNQLKKDLGLEINRRDIDGERLKKDVLGASMTKDLGYMRDHWQSGGKLKREEYDSVAKFSASALDRKFGSDKGTGDGWSQIRLELGLGTNTWMTDNEVELTEEGDEIMEDLTSIDEEGMSSYMTPN